MVPGGRTQTTTDPAEIAATSGADALGIDFGSFAGAAISGQAFDDLDGDGVRDGGESGLSGVTIELDLGANGSVDQTTTTNGSGAYSFPGLSPGTYRVRQVVPAGRSQTTANPGDPVVPPGASGVDFGSRATVAPPAPSSPPAVETPGTIKVEPDDKPDKLTQEQRQQKDHTNTANLDEYHTEGNVVAVERTSDGKYLLVTIGLVRSEKLVVQVACPDAGAATGCPDIRIGDYVEADGWQGGKEEQGRFIAEDVTVRRNGRRIR